MSIRVQILITAITISLLAILAGASVLWAFDSAESKLQRALLSYQQLASATELDGAAARLILSRANSEQEEYQFIEDPQAEVDQALGSIKDFLAQELSSTRLGSGQSDFAAERDRIANISERYNRLRSVMQTQPSREKNWGQISTPEIHNAYIAVEKALAEYVAEERNEVAEVAADLHAMRNMLKGLVSIIAALVLIVVIAIARLSYKGLMAPINKLLRGASNFAAGNLSYELEVTSPVEFAELGKGLSSMAREIAVQQSALTSINENLEATVATRTRELERKARELESIDQARRLFFAKVSHELRTPLTALLGEAELGKKTLNSPTLERITAHGGMLDRRIKDLLAIARSEDGELALTLQPTELMDVIKLIKSATEAYARALSVELQFSIDLPESVELIADRDWFAHALIAIVENALKHSPPETMVSVTAKLQAHNFVFEVIDQGAGVPAEEIPLLTAPFVRVGHQNDVQGSGLGLTVVDWVVKTHCGELRIANGENGGLCVTVTIATLG